MKKGNQNISLLAVAILAAMAIAFSGCKTKKKVAAVSAQENYTEEEPYTEENVEMEPPRQEEVTTKDRQTKKVDKEQLLSNYFRAIASAPSTASANASIDEALGMFGTTEAPVLIVIYRAGGQPDYDEPTTIVKYLNYLKDTKNNKAQVEEVVYDTNGKIKELVLKK